MQIPGDEDLRLLAVIDGCRGGRRRYAFVDIGAQRTMHASGPRAGFRPYGSKYQSLSRYARKTETFRGGNTFPDRVRLSSTAGHVLQSRRRFLSTPFGRQVMAETMERIARHLNKTGTEAYAVYVNPRHREELANNGFILIDKGNKSSEDWTIWHRPARQTPRRSSDLGNA